MLKKSICLKELRLLVVDDDPDTRKILATLFKLEGSEVMTVASAPEALEAMLHFKPNILICDICLPGEDGYSLLEKIRMLNKEQTQPEIPAIALTAFVHEEDRTYALLAGFQSYLYKPVDLKELVFLVSNLIEPGSNCN
ncbi:Response regulatory domain-containing protein [Nostoc sp. DSM 114161]|jgi:two-component system OmpR family response regulator|uniref:response regulator n=1 Tax=Nostoc sp. DSM 114161 TaxID=3440143 RepID=UPI00404640AF